MEIVPPYYCMNVNFYTRATTRGGKPILGTAPTTTHMGVLFYHIFYICQDFGHIGEVYGYYNLAVALCYSIKLFNVAF